MLKGRYENIPESLGNSLNTTAGASALLPKKPLPRLAEGAVFAHCQRLLTAVSGSVIATHKIIHHKSIANNHYRENSR